MLWGDRTRRHLRHGAPLEVNLRTWDHMRLRGGGHLRVHVVLRDWRHWLAGGGHLCSGTNLHLWVWGDLLGTRGHGDLLLLR